MERLKTMPKHVKGKRSLDVLRRSSIVEVARAQRTLKTVTLITSALLVSDTE
jgi:hypothetical protein